MRLLELCLCFFLYGTTAVAEPDDPRELNKAAIDKLRNDLNSKPLIANRLSRDKSTKEFLEGGNSSNPNNNPGVPVSQPSSNDVPPSERPPSDSSSHSFDAVPPPVPTTPPAPPEVPLPPPPEMPSEMPPVIPPPTAPLEAPPEQPPETIPLPESPPEASPEGEGAAMVSEGEKVQSENKADKIDKTGENKTDSEAQTNKITYNRKTVIFYRKECQLNRCVSVPVLTNLKSVIFNYNQGRYPASVVEISSTPK